MAFSYMLFVFMTLMVYEVISRYFFRSPTIWVHEICGFLFAAYIAFTGAWVLLEKGHVAVDIIYQYFPNRVKCIADILVSLVAFGLFAVLLWQGWNYAWYAFKTNQHSHTVFGPPLWPVKMMLPVGALLFLTQLIADLGRSLLELKERSAE
jgi:TRAP-type C4-dicarboxylate transport system permease small subunit